MTAATKPFSQKVFVCLDALTILTVAVAVAGFVLSKASYAGAASEKGFRRQVGNLTLEVHMTLFSSATVRNGSEDAEIWANLRDAIANSSGFQGWKQQQDEHTLDTQPLDQLVRLYLRETLETLAY